MTIDIDFSKPDDSFWEILGWRPSSEQIKQFILLQKLLSKWNQQVNLTRLLKDDDYWIMQVFDSLWPFKNELHQRKESFNSIDVGSGCGFPGLAIAIAFPEANITLVDAINRKTNALKEICKELALISRVEIINERIEDIGQNHLFRNSFDFAFARAVGSAPVVAEYLIPLIKSNGEAILFKGKWEDSEKEALNNALSILKARISKVEYMELPKEKGIRHQIRLKSNYICPKIYPRSIGIPKKRPLGS